MTEGERRIYTFISDGLEASEKKWRGSHTLRIYYKDSWPICQHCKQDVRTDSDMAYNMFLNASLEWDGELINHDDLRVIMLEQNEKAIDSQGKFRSPGSYGLDPFREWGRRELGKSIVLIDLDIAVRRYGSRFGIDSEGDLMLVEKKEHWPNSA